MSTDALPLTFAEILARTAESQIGTEERAQHDNRGAAIEKYQRATNLDGTGWPWCAAFVDWCFKEAQMELPAVGNAPSTAAAFGLISWGEENHLMVSRPGVTPNSAPRRGDIVVYAFSHCGIVTGTFPHRPGAFEAVEGNTNAQGGRDGYQVARRTRGLSAVRAFIRLPGTHLPSAPLHAGKGGQA